MQTQYKEIPKARFFDSPIVLIEKNECCLMSSPNHVCPIIVLNHRIHNGNCGIKTDVEDVDSQGVAIALERSTTNNTFGGTASVVDKNSSPPEEDLASAVENKDTKVNTFNIILSSSHFASTTR